MNQEEDKITKLFQQTRAEDARNAPSFADVWNAALSRQGRPGHRWIVWRLAAATTVLILIGTGSWIYLRQSAIRQALVEIVGSNMPAPDTTTKQQAPIEIVKSATPISDATPPQRVSPLRVSVKNPPKVTRRQRLCVRPQPAATSISQWRSPTESLLRTPGEQLFKRVPRLNESLVNIKAIILDKKD